MYMYIMDTCICIWWIHVYVYGGYMYMYMVDTCICIWWIHVYVYGGCDLLAINIGGTSFTT